MAISKNSEIKAADINNEIIAPLESLRHDHTIMDASSRVIVKTSKKKGLSKVGKSAAIGTVVERELQDKSSSMKVYTPSTISKVSAGTETNSQTAPKEIANLLDSLLNHVHVYMDDYGTACNCNCNCNCNCTRGIM